MDWGFGCWRILVLKPPGRLLDFHPVRLCAVLRVCEYFVTAYGLCGRRGALVELVLQGDP